MLYIEGRLRQALALKPEYETAIEQLRSVGLTRLAEALLPVVATANDLAAELAAVHDQWVADNAIVDMKAEILAVFELMFAERDAAVSAQLADTAGLAAAVQLRQDRADADRWFFNHG